MTIDWANLFIPSNSLIELVIRGSVMYLSIFVLFRIFRRDAGALNIADLLLVVLIADAAQNGLAGEYKTITEGLVLVATLAFWNYLIDNLSFHYPSVQKLLDPPSLQMVKDGRMLKSNMRTELISREELMSQLRQHGVDSLEDVKSCVLESDGQFSVIRKDSGSVDKKKKELF